MNASISLYQKNYFALAASVRSIYMTYRHIGGCPADVQQLVAQVKTVVGDWEDQESAQLFNPLRVTVACKMIHLAMKQLPPTLLENTYVQLPVMPATWISKEVLVHIISTTAGSEAWTPYDSEEINRFWRELTSRQDLYQVQCLAVKYGLPWQLEN